MSKKKKPKVKAYMPNPLADDPGFIPRKKRRKKKKKVIPAKITKGEKRRIQLHQYKERAKRLRPLFRGVFDAEAGFDLRKPDKWTPAQKAKVTRYFREMAPHITGAHVVKRYRKPSSMQAVVKASGQDRLLPGQTGIPFRYDEATGPKSVKVKLSRSGRVTVTRQGIRTQRLDFDMDAFLDNFKDEVNRVLNLTDAQVFRIQTGKFEQNLALRRDEVMPKIVELVERYDPANISRSQNQLPFYEFIFGLVAYEGTPKTTLNKTRKLIKIHKKEMEEKRRAHLKELATKRKAERLRLAKAIPLIKVRRKRR